MSEILKIEVTETTPALLFDVNKGILILKGKSIPENPIPFYEPLLKQVEKYAENPVSENMITIEMDYFNTPSAKYLLDILKHYEAIIDKGNKVSVLWRYEKGDTDMLQAGKDYQNFLGKLSFEFQEIF